jgi:hypothetical protein
VKGGRFSWLGGRSDPAADAASVRRAHNHRRHATKTDRHAQADFDRRDRRLFGDVIPFRRPNR